ncbi:hypothetical protein K2173_000040 [Erythroxylum novogranatense]|uniref:Uncharacterized protein n=1 Tax=Erythroxylum novogranatense TaxID=1862640 RepID=A0AAV8SNA1_9ROSI|nr:hypothetical protein K2173_000040 [Erythroxylum novogranatense]
MVTFPAVLRWCAKRKNDVTESSVDKSCLIVISLSLSCPLTDIRALYSLLRHSHRQLIHRRIYISNHQPTEKVKAKVVQLWHLLSTTQSLELVL